MGYQATSAAASTQPFPSSRPKEQSTPTTACWGKGEHTTLRSMTLSFPYSNED
jgi:hypothetical protein